MPRAVEIAGAELDTHFYRANGPPLVFQRRGDGWHRLVHLPPAPGQRPPRDEQGRFTVPFADTGRVSPEMGQVLDRFPHTWTLLVAREDGAPPRDLVVHWIDPEGGEAIYLGGGPGGDEALTGARLGMQRALLARAGVQGVAG